MGTAEHCLKVFLTAHSRENNKTAAEFHRESLRVAKFSMKCNYTDLGVASPQNLGTYQGCHGCLCQ